jgi:hypothetical protein
MDRDLPGTNEVRDRMAALTSARDLVSDLNTWASRPETPRWLASALVIPLAPWIATQLLERAAGWSPACLRGRALASAWAHQRQ